MTGTIPAMRMIRTAIAGILALLAVATASAQTPQFPQTMPPNTVWGRLGISAGPPQAIPFATLFSSQTWLSNLVGAVPRTISSKLSDVVSVMDFGATGNGSTDDTAAMQACHNTGKVCYYPPATYIFSTLSFSAGGIICAPVSGTNLGLVSTDNTTANIITYTGTGTSSNKPVFDGCLIQSANGTKSAGAALAFAPLSGETVNAYINNNIFLNFPVGVHFIRAGHWIASNNRIYNAKVAGYWVENQNNADSGDSLISGGLINDGYSLGKAVLYNSAGGLKIHGVKMLGGSTGVSLEWNGAVSSGDLMLNGPNSIEGMTVAAVHLGRASGVTNFSHISINGLQTAGIPLGIDVDTSGAIFNLSISGGIIGGNTTAINIGTATNFAVGGAVIVGTNCIVIGAGSTNGTVGANSYTTCATQVSDASGTAVINGKVPAGGTGITSYAVGDLLVASGTTALSKLADVATNNVLCSGGVGVAPSYCKPTPAALSGLGTGVATALGVNIGTAGSFVVNGGALGSPSSAGTIPAFTLGGTVSGGGNQINNAVIGASSPLAGSFTTLGASGVLSSTNTTDASSISTGAITSLGGGSFAKKLFTGDTAIINALSANIVSAGPLTIGGATKAQLAGSSAIALASNDASNPFQGTIQISGDATAGNRRIAISAIEQGVAFRNVSLAEGGGAVAVGCTSGLVTAGNLLEICGTGGGLKVDSTTASTSSATGSGLFSGGIGAAGAVWAGTYLATTVTTVAGLPTCGAGIKGARMFVSDNNTALAFAAVITSGGAIQTPVYCDGTVWRQG